MLQKTRKTIACNYTLHDSNLRNHICAPNVCVSFVAFVAISLHSMQLQQLAFEISPFFQHSF
jgi:hypothetical protein